MDEADRDALKRQAAEHAVQFVQSGMVVGLGTGSTAIHATRRIAALVHEGALRDVVGFATSRAVWDEAVQLGLPMLTEDMPRAIDLTIDGADEIDPELNLIKGGGGALLREKIVAQASARVVIVADDSKLSPRLGTHWAVPVEVLDFGWQTQARFLAALGAQVAVRQGKRTDQGNMILDCRFGPITNATDLAAALDAHAGIVAHGLFLKLAHEAVIADRDGIKVMQAASRPS
ncbi:MAG TPA: ribose-5-phosphate isomerase RpiA [Acetobacteraceae bacterium]|nr:ribose-5-phosphate isomerase RpiA [Acetobacteraceae bacterium]